MRRMVRGAWVTAVLLAAVEACSSGSSPSYEEMSDSGGAPHYDGSTTQDSAGDTAPGADATHEAAMDGGGGGGEAAEASPADDAGEAGAGPEAAAEAAAGPESGPEASVTEGGAEAAVEASAEAAAEASVEASVEAAAEAGLDAAADAAPESSSTQEAGPDASAEAATIVPPVCDGVVSAAEYGGTGNQSSSGGQTWYMTWDDTNLYVGIANASIVEGMILYVAIAPGTDAGPAGQLTSGQAYDYTDATALPFAAGLVVYAKDGYTEARVPSGGSWGAPNQTAVVQCDNGTTEVREEVIPWSLVGGPPSSFGWLGYFAAAGNTQGFIYGQMPTGNPTGTPAGNATFTQYFEITSATSTPLPFADVQ
jgi:hypothetical protein